MCTLTPSSEVYPGETCSGSSAPRCDPLLSEAAESSTALEFDCVEHNNGTRQSWGDYMDEILPTTDHGTQEENPANFTVTMDEVLMGILSDYKLSLATLGGFSEGDTRAGDEEDDVQNQVLRTEDLSNEADGSTPALIDLSKCLGRLHLHVYSRPGF